MRVNVRTGNFSRNPVRAQSGPDWADGTAYLTAVLMPATAEQTAAGHMPLIWQRSETLAAVS